MHRPLKEKNMVTTSNVHATIAQIQEDEDFSVNSYALADGKAYEVVRISYNALMDAHTFELPEVTEKEKDKLEQLKVENKALVEKGERFNSRLFWGVALVAVAGCIVYNLVTEPQNIFPSESQLSATTQAIGNFVNHNNLALIGGTSVGLFLFGSALQWNSPQFKAGYKKNQAEIKKIDDKQYKREESSRVLSVLDKMLTNFEQANPGRDYDKRTVPTRTPSFKLT